MRPTIDPYDRTKHKVDVLPPAAHSWQFRAWIALSATASRFFDWFFGVRTS